jgi:hypothetical protein
LIREPVTWPEVFLYLTEGGGVKAVQPAEAYAKSSKGGCVCVCVFIILHA